MRKQYDQILASMLQPLPIESAPKDGTVIDVFSSKIGRITNAYWHDYDECWADDFQNYDVIYITHWLPIPQVKGE